MLFHSKHHTVYPFIIHYPLINMAIIKYQVKENKTLGTHSFYAQAVSY